jgi:predicted PurR-regulated permease PerM
LPAEAAWHFKEQNKRLLLMIHTEYPPYVRLSLNLLSLALILLGLYLASAILVPLSFAILLAALLLPFVNYLIRLRVNRVLAIVSSIILSLLVIGTVIYFLSTQIGNFLDDIPTLKQRFGEVLYSVKRWVQENFNIEITKQNQYLNETAEKVKTNGTSIVQTTVVTLTEIFSYVLFLPVYTFLILYHKELIKRFLCEVFKKTSDKDEVMDAIYEAQGISQQYLMGLLIELMIVFALNAIGFLVLGIKYAIFLALLSALLNLVPYIGMITAGLFCMLITMISDNDISHVLWTGGILYGVQIIDNNFLMPFIVGSKIKINSMAIILGVLLGGALWGVPGMFLAIPALAVLKVVLERMENLKPWAIILGDDVITSEEENPVKKAALRAGRKASRIKDTKDASRSAKERIE